MASLNLQISTGDARDYIVALEKDGVAFSPDTNTGTLVFTVKNSYLDEDADAVFQKALGAGITLDGSNATLSILRADSIELEAKKYFIEFLWLDTDSELSQPVAAGILEVDQRLTREQQTSVDVITTDEPLPFGPAIPSQTGNSGKALTTNGTTMSWSVVSSDLTSGPVTSSGGVSAIADSALSIAKTSGLQTALDAKSPLDVEATADSINSQPWSMAKVSAWNSSTSTPLRGAFIGDSLSNTGGDMGLGPFMGSAGCIGLSVRSGSTSGTVTIHGPTARTDIWINGQGTTFAIGSSAEFTQGGSASGDVRGDQACIGYIAGPGKGTFDLQYQANATGAWTTLATINTANASTIGVWATYSLPSTNFPYYRLRVNNVTGGIVELPPLMGIYNTTGGGAIYMPIGMCSGLDLASHVAATPSAVFTPLWTGLAPDFVFSIWADAASEWETGGAFRAFYARAIAAKSQTDWIQISRNPSNEPEGIPYSIAVAQAQAAAQRAWALETKQTFINGHEIHGGSWTVANARGLMTDNTHLSSAGATHRNACLWPKLPLGQAYLQGGWKIGQNTASGGQQLIASNFSQAFPISVPLELTGSTAALRQVDQSTPLRGDRITQTYTATERQTFARGSTIGGYFDYGSGLIGLYPGGNNWALGSTSARWNAFAASFSGGIVTKSAAYTATGSDFTILCDATSAAFAITLPSASTHSGRIYIIKKTDASGNAITITGTVDGTTNPTLTGQWQRLIIQSNGTNWTDISTTGIIPITSGGTGATSAAAAWTGLGGSGTISRPGFSGVDVTYTGTAYAMDIVKTGGSRFGVYLGDTASSQIGTFNNTKLVLTTLGNSRMEISSGGAVSISSTLAVTGTATATGGLILGSFTVAAFPSTTYLMGVVTDALAPVVGSAVAAGGSAKCIVCYNGTSKIVTALL